jgi:hypothetical protein
VGYTVNSWVDFGVAVAGCAGALVGLLFVAVSIRSSAVSASLNLRSRAAETLVLFMTSVVVSIVLVAPQSGAALGGELLAWAFLSGTLYLILDRRAGRGATNRAARYVERFSPNVATSVLLAIAGATFLAKRGGGLYWLLPTMAGSLLGGVVNAWFFLVSEG